MAQSITCTPATTGEGQVSDELATGIVLLLMLVGLIGTLIPVLPGILLEWAAVIGYG